MDAQMKQLLADVMANSAALNACTGPHQFTQEVPGTMVMMKKMKCTKCGGMIDPINLLWYKRGLAHGALGRT
jgi:hypothetical protein